MRARHRHFNPKDAGAIAAYDARFISGLSDGDGVATWSSRTGTNDATQSTASAQPKYETNEINGNPVVNFTPANNHQLIISITNPASSTTISVLRRSASNIETIGFGGSGPTVYPWWWYSADTVPYTSWNGSVQSYGASAVTGSMILSCEKNGTTSSRLYRNGATFLNSITPNASSGTFNRIGRVPGQSNNGAIGNLCLLDSFASNSLRKRLEHAAAFSFKLACS